jgi:hypothetical protein
MQNTMVAELDPIEILKSPCLYLDRQLLATILTRIHLFEKIVDIQGSIVECGVYKANSLMLYQHLSSMYEPFNFHRKIIGFDTFEGFPSFSAKDNSIATKLDFSDTSYEHIKKWINLHDQNRPIGHLQKTELVKGNALKTIPQYVNDNPHLIIALLYLDFDLYEPTKIALEYLLPLVPKGGIVGFDELNQERWQGETTAFKECTFLSKVNLRRFFYEPSVSYYVVE